MKLDELHFVGDGTKLIVKEDCTSARGLGYTVLPLKKGDEILCFGKNIKGEDSYFICLHNDKTEVVVFCDQVELAIPPFDITKTTPIESVNDLYAGMKLVVTKENHELGVGHVVTLIGVNTSYNREVRVKFEYDGNYIYSDRGIYKDYLGIPEGQKTKTEILKRLMDYLKNPSIVLSVEEREDSLRLLEKM